MNPHFNVLSVLIDGQCVGQPLVIHHCKYEIFSVLGVERRQYLMICSVALSIGTSKNDAIGLTTQDSPPFAPKISLSVPFVWCNNYTQHSTAAPCPLSAPWNQLAQFDGVFVLASSCAFWGRVHPRAAGGKNHCNFLYCFVNFPGVSRLPTLCKHQHFPPQRRALSVVMLPSCQATADRRRRATPGAGAATGAAQSLGFGGGSGGGGQGEQCPQCGASFGNVGALVAHVDAFHSDVSWRTLHLAMRAKCLVFFVVAGWLCRYCFVL